MLLIAGNICLLIIKIEDCEFLPENNTLVVNGYMDFMQNLISN